MKVEKKNTLAFFSDLYEYAKSRYLPILDKMEENMAQYGGSKRIDGSYEEASVVRNITYELIEGEISSEIPMPHVSPYAYSEKWERNAKSAEELCTMLRHALPFEEMNDKDERYTYIYGGSVWYLEWDDLLPFGSQRGGVRISCLPPKNLIPEPYVAEIADMEYCFLRFNTTRDELRRRYHVSEEVALLASPEPESAGDGSDELVTVIVCFYKNERGEVSEFVFSGEATLRHIDNYYRRRRSVCTVCGEGAMNCLCDEPRIVFSSEEHELLFRDIHLSDGRMIPKMSPKVDKNGCIMRRNGDAVMEKTALPYYIPNRFPIVVRRNVSRESSLFGESDCAIIRPQQQAVNKLESRIMQKLMRAGVTPVLPEDATLSVTNAVFGQILRMKPGESRASYGVIDTTPSIQQDIQEAERLYNQAKRILGITDTYIGLSDDTAQSGRAKEIQVAQAAGRLESKRRMKNAAYAEIDRIMFELFLAYADEPRPIPYKDLYGRTHNALFNRYDFLEYLPERGVYLFGDAYLFSVDKTGLSEHNRTLVWEKNLENLKMGTLGKADDDETLLRYWQMQERAHYPFAAQHVEYFTRRMTERSHGHGASLMPRDGTVLKEGAGDGA